MTEIRDILADLLNRQARSDKNVQKVLKQQRAMQANVDLCINYIQGESLEKAATIRARTGVSPGSYPDVADEEDTQPGRRQ